MKKFTRLFCLSTLALGIASAATPYDVTLLDNVSVGKTELKAGDYKGRNPGRQSRLYISKKTVTIPATLGKSEQTFASTVFISQHAKLKEIDLGGTQDKILFAGN